MSIYAYIVDGGKFWNIYCEYFLPLALSSTDFFFVCLLLNNANADS